MIVACVIVLALWVGDGSADSRVLVPAASPRFAIGIVVPRRPINGGEWVEGDREWGPMPAIREALKDPTITRSFVEEPLIGQPTAEGLRLGTVLVTLTTFDTIEHLPEAMRQAAASIGDDSGTLIGPPLPDTAASRKPYRHLLVVVDRWSKDPSTLASIRAARNDLIGKPDDAMPPIPGRAMIDQINAVAIRHSTALSHPPITRQDVKTHLTESQVQFAAVDDETNLGLAAESNDAGPLPPNTGYVSPWQNPDLPNLWHRLLLRMTACPSDFNRDGQSISAPGVPFSDLDAFDAAYGISNSYTDWDFNGSYPGSGTTFDDGKKFSSGFQAGCPNN
jgi:hypothetical protein